MFEVSSVREGAGGLNDGVSFSSCLSFFLLLLNRREMTMRWGWGGHACCPGKLD